jgi:hypothetical protein
MDIADTAPLVLGLELAIDMDIATDLPPLVPGLWVVAGLELLVNGRPDAEPAGGVTGRSCCSLMVGSTPFHSSPTPQSLATAPTLGGTDAMLTKLPTLQLLVVLAKLGIGRRCPVGKLPDALKDATNG